MKTIKTLFAAVACFIVAISCDKTPSSDAIVSFADNYYEFYLEEGPNFTIPIDVTGANISYPYTIVVNSLPETEENGYSERNVDYRFLERRIVVEGPGDKPEVTVRVINSDLDVLYVGLTIESVEGGSGIGAVSTSEIYAAPAVSYSNGIYQVKGILNGTDAYTETWDFFNEGSDVAFYGLLGMTEENGSYPIMGSSLIDEESGAVVMLFELGLYNSVAAAYFNLPTTGRTACYMAPMILNGNYLYDGYMDFIVIDRDNIYLDLEEGDALTYALYSYPDEKFTGYTYDDLAIDGNVITRTSGNSAAAAAAAAASVPGSVMLNDIKTGESFVTTFEKIDIARPAKTRE